MRARGPRPRSPPSRPWWTTCPATRSWRGWPLRRKPASACWLFPLQVVLFPGMVLPLRVFEERYKQMIGRCLETNEGFGVVLIREGQEVGEPATPFDVGTLAEIASVERLPGGMMNLVTVGTRR